MKFIKKFEYKVGHALQVLLVAFSKSQPQDFFISKSQIF